MTDISTSADASKLEQPSGDVGKEDEEKTMHHKKKKRTKPFLYLVAASAALGALVFGFSLTGAGGTFVMTSFRLEFNWECPTATTAPADDTTDTCMPKSEREQNKEQSLITSLQSIGAIGGAIFNSGLIDRVGRRWTLFQAALVFSVGAAIQAGSHGTIELLYLGRFFGGFGIGMLSMSIPIYIAECSPSHNRGFLVTFWQAGVTIGMLLGTAVNVAVKDEPWGWKLSYGAPLIFAGLLMLACASYMPESPRYLATKELGDDDNNNGSDNRSGEGVDDIEQGEKTSSVTITEETHPKLHAVLRRIRYEDEIKNSVRAIDQEVREEAENGVATWREVFRRSDHILYRVLLGMAMQFFSQLSGNEMINFYAPVILERIFSSGQSLISSFLLGIVNFIAVIFALFTVDRVGRVPLWVLGGLVMMFSQIANSVLQSLAPTTTTDNLFLAGLSVFTFAYHSTMGPLVWDINSEMFPVRERGKAVALTTMSNFVGVVLVGAVFPFAMDASPVGVFVFFTIMLIINTAMVYFLLPETGEKSPMQIEEQFAQHKPKMLRNVFYKDHHD